MTQAKTYQKQLEVEVAPKEKPSFKENTTLAKRILAACIVIAFCVIGPVKLGSLRKEAVDVFRHGTSTKYTVSVYNDIQTSANSASILAGLAEAELGKTEDTKKLASLAEDLIKEDDADDLLEDFASLVQVANTVYSAYEKQVGTASTDAQKAIRNINSARTTVMNDAYWTYASDFNETRSGFPAKLMALIGGVHKLPDKLG